MGASTEGNAGDGGPASADVVNAAADAGSTVPAATAPTTPRVSGRKRRRELPPDVHVRWDEATIAEHDKERGTRQKIDEPPTPFAWSPPSASEDSDAAGASPGSTPTRCGVPSSAVPLNAVDPAEVAARLCQLAAERGRAVDVSATSPEPEEGAVEALAERAAPAAPAASPPPAAAPSPAHVPGPFREAVQHRWAEEPPHGEEPLQGARQSNCHTVFAGVAGAGEPKPSSASFRAKRAQHYDEFKMLQAFRQKQAAKGEADDDD
uniref:Protein phosphatase inhibitor 2 n=1 Tax=Pyrodinium bahamense TaxID=73915 RepID=A0A7S0AN76_9DINO